MPLFWLAAVAILAGFYLIVVRAHADRAMCEEGNHLVSTRYLRRNRLGVLEIDCPRCAEDARAVAAPLRGALRPDDTQEMPAITATVAVPARPRPVEGAA